MAAAFGVAAIAACAMVVEWKVSSLVAGLGESFETKVYGAPVLANKEPRERLVQRLRRLGYRKVDREPKAGEYRVDGEEIAAHLRGFSNPIATQQAGVFKLNQEEPAWLEPELVATLCGKEQVRRSPLRSQEIPDVLRRAVIAAEDKRFYSHVGIDPAAVVRAAWHNLTGRGGLSGGSTITQQLAKNLFLTQRRTLSRKALEAGLALYLDLTLGKEEILTLYLNHIYLAQDGPYSVAGMRAASRHFFSVEPKELGLLEAATLAGLIRSPYRYNPLRHPEAARGRRDFVLKRMHAEGFLSRKELERALPRPLGLRPQPFPHDRKNDHGYFVAEVEKALVARYGEDSLHRGGLSVHTTMDPLLQRAAALSLKRGRFEAALAALDPSDGKVLALAGGRDFAASPFNRAVAARRQPGSAFKPFVFGAALENGLDPATPLSDEPRQYPGLTGPWAPKNYDGIYFGTATTREALSRSLNLATLDAASRVGPAKIAEFARRLGVTSPLHEDLALALGASEVSPLELTAAYAALANGGFAVRPYFIAAVSDHEGKVLEFSRGERVPALTPELAYLLTSMLRSAVQEGTGKVLALHGWTAPTAGKTGTSNEGRDAWFVGFTPALLAGVWTGDDKNAKAALTGAKDAIPLWASFMKLAQADAAGEFPAPAGIVTAVIDPQSGLLARPGCPERRPEEFIAGREPVASCPLHAGGLVGWFKRLFGDAQSLPRPSR